MTNGARNSDDGLLTRILQRVAAGDPGAGDALLPLVYDELRELAHRRVMRLGPGQTLQATDLVHEAWDRLGGGAAAPWRDRAHFFGSAARAMRFILVEHQRRRNREKRGGGRQREPLHDNLAAPETSEPVDFCALDRALRRLEEHYPRAGRLVMLRYFGGLKMEQIAATLEVSLRSVEREWLFARSWLRRVMEEELQETGDDLS